MMHNIPLKVVFSNIAHSQLPSYSSNQPQIQMDISSEMDPIQSEYVTLVSSDGFTFVILREAAMISGTLNGMLNASAFAEARYGRVHLGNISGNLLEKICEYLCYNLKYKDKSNVPDFDVPPEMALELLVAADFLDSKYPPMRRYYFQN